MWRRLGAQVTVVEFLDRILPGIDNEVARQSQRLLEKQGIKFQLASKVTGVENGGQEAEGSASSRRRAARAEVIDADVVLVSIGRVPFTDGLGLEEAGVKKDNKGRVVVDAHYASQRPRRLCHWRCHSWADARAQSRGRRHRVASSASSPANGHVDYNSIPGVVYTEPEIASVGQTEDQLKEQKIEYRKGVFPFLANGRARALNKTEGRVKILADAKTDRVLGVHIIGPRAGDLIAEAAVAMAYGASSEDIARASHAHPTLAEAVKEAALAVNKRAIHM